MAGCPVAGDDFEKTDVIDMTFQDIQGWIIRTLTSSSLVSLGRYLHFWTLFPEHSHHPLRIPDCMESSCA